MALDICQSGVLIGSSIRSRYGCYAYSPEDQAIGQFADNDGAAFALAARAALELVAA